MIAFVQGTVFAFGSDWVILDNHGIGYRIFYPHPEKLKLNEETRIFTYQHIREDENSLYGFSSMEEVDLFLKLISVKGLGPKTAMNMLARASYQMLTQAIENKDVAFMKSMPGIGAKTASQIILDLQGKLVSSETDKEINEQLQDALDALKSLGYKSVELTQVSKYLAQQSQTTTDEYVKMALQWLLKRKGG